jgi:hypothetical protein
MKDFNTYTGTFIEVHSFIPNFHCLATCGTRDKVFKKIEYGYVHKKVPFLAENHLVVFVASSSRATTLYLLFTCALTIYHVPKKRVKFAEGNKPLYIFALKSLPIVRILRR